MSISYQQNPLLQRTLEDKEDALTQDQTSINDDNDSITLKIQQNILNAQNKLHQQQSIFVKLSHNTFSADKILKLVSGIIKFLKNFNCLHRLKTVQKLAGEIGQLRRLLRVDRVLLIIKEMNGCLKKSKLTNHDLLMIVFRSLLLFQDCNDMLAYLIQLKVLKGDQWLATLKKRIANLYFVECIGWLIYYIYEYKKSSNQQMKHKYRINIIKYSVDIMISHNQTTMKLFSLSPKFLSILSLTSALLNISLVWK